MYHGRQRTRGHSAGVLSRLPLYYWANGHVSLDKNQVQHIATLARLTLADSEMDEVFDKLSRIVEFVDQLKTAETSGVEPMAHPLNQVQRLRPDTVTESDEREEIQKNAPSVRDGLYLVPKVIE